MTNLFFFQMSIYIKTFLVIMEELPSLNSTFIFEQSCTCEYEISAFTISTIAVLQCSLEGALYFTNRVMLVKYHCILGSPPPHLRL